MLWHQPGAASAALPGRVPAPPPGCPATRMVWWPQVIHPLQTVAPDGEGSRAYLHPVA
jgi:hypothetical protein